MTTIKTISGHALTHHDAVSASGPAEVTFAGVVAALARWIKAAVARRRGRHALAAMSEAQLKDIGITRLQAELEASKPFWR